MKIICFFVTVLTLTLYSCSSKIVHCPDDNRKVVIRKNPEKAYPRYAKDFFLKLGGTIKYLEKINIADLSVETKSNIQKLAQDLNQNSLRIESLLKASYLIYANDPCNKDAANKYYSVLEKVESNLVAIGNLETQIEKAAKSLNFNGINEINQVIKELQNENNILSNF